MKKLEDVLKKMFDANEDVLVAEDFCNLDGSINDHTYMYKGAVNKISLNVLSNKYVSCIAYLKGYNTYIIYIEG